MRSGTRCRADPIQIRCLGSGQRLPKRRLQPKSCPYRATRASTGPTAHRKALRQARVIAFRLLLGDSGCDGLRNDVTCLPCRSRDVYEPKTEARYNSLWFIGPASISRSIQPVIGAEQRRRRENSALPGGRVEGRIYSTAISEAETPATCTGFFIARGGTAGPAGAIPETARSRAQ